MVIPSFSTLYSYSAAFALGLLDMAVALLLAGVEAVVPPVELVFVLLLQAVFKIVAARISTAKNVFFDLIRFSFRCLL